MEFYSAELHKALLLGNKIESDGGINLVCFRVLKNNTKKIEYKYIHYPEVFVNSVLLYIITKKNLSKSLLFKDWGDFLTIIDNKFYQDNIRGYLLKNHESMNCHFKEYISYNNFSYDSMIQLLDLVKKLTIVSDNVVVYIDRVVNKQYSDLLKDHITGEVNDNELSNVYLLKEHNKRLTFYSRTTKIFRLWD